MAIRLQVKDANELYEVRGRIQAFAVMIELQETFKKCIEGVKE